ncbi:hypothetical protein Drorol1_Dr00013696 [Drosera rotundifolia]
MENPSSSSHSPTISLSSLICHETETPLTSCLDHDQLHEQDDPFLHFTNHHPISASESDDDYIVILLERESSMLRSICSPPKLARLMETDVEWMNQARLVAIDYIINARALLGFRLQTAYLSITYFDQFLSKRSVDSGKSWTIELLSVACLSLAAKLEECRLPSLTEFQVREFKFENRIIQRMELLVLDTLEWKVSSVTPFAYLLYFINKFQADHQSPFSKGIVSRSINLILGIAREINLIEHYQYAIACAAVLMAVDRRLSRKAFESKMDAISLNKLIDIEDVFTCYNIMQRLEELGKVQELSSPTMTSASQRPPTTSSISLKRKRLTFDDTGH